MESLNKLSRIEKRREFLFFKIASQREQLKKLIRYDLQRPLKLAEVLFSAVLIIKKYPLRICFFSFLAFRSLHFIPIKKWLSYTEFAWRLIRKLQSI